MKQGSNIISIISSSILSIHQKTPTLVAIDGVDASGKTCFANQLSFSFRSSVREIIRISIDDFHNPKSIRYRKGRNSPEGYYRDTTNYQAFIKYVLKPLGKHGNLKYKKAIFDLVKDEKLNSPFFTAEKDAIVLIDGIFLLRPEFVNYWDYKILLHADFSVTVPRAILRDRLLLSGEKSNMASLYKKRYIPGQQIYFKEAKPQKSADVIINNENFEDPTLIDKTSFFSV